MGHHLNARRAIEERFTTAWAGATTVLFENAKTASPAATAYVSLTILTGKPHYASIGRPPKRRYVGVVVVRIFVPEGTGMKAIEEFVELAESAFFDTTNLIGRQLSLTNGLITFHEPPERATVGKAGGFHQTTISFPFYRDQNGA